MSNDNEFISVTIKLKIAGAGEMDGYELHELCKNSLGLINQNAGVQLQIVDKQTEWCTQAAKLIKKLIQKLTDNGIAYNDA